MADTPPESKPRNEMTVLAPLLALYTTAYLGVQIAEFALRGAVATPAGMMAIYVSLLGAYAADKEIRRWVGRQEPARRGSVFVVFWLAFFLVAWLIRAFRPEFRMPGDLIPVVLQVVGIFLGSKTSKALYERRVGVSVISPQGEDAVLEWLRTHDRLTRKDVMALLQVSDNTADRLLQQMVGRGLVRREGVGRGTFYVATPP